MIWRWCASCPAGNDSIALFLLRSVHSARRSPDPSLPQKAGKQHDLFPHQASAQSTMAPDRPRQKMSCCSCRHHRSSYSACRGDCRKMVLFSILRKESVVYRSYEAIPFLCFCRHIPLCTISVMQRQDSRVLPHYITEQRWLQTVLSPDHHKELFLQVLLRFRGYPGAGQNCSVQRSDYSSRYPDRNTGLRSL